MFPHFKMCSTGMLLVKNVSSCVRISVFCQRTSRGSGCWCLRNRNQRFLQPNAPIYLLFFLLLFLLSCLTPNWALKTVLCPFWDGKWKRNVNTVILEKLHDIKQQWKPFGYRVDFISVLKPELWYILLIVEYFKIILKLGCGSGLKAPRLLFRRRLQLRKANPCGSLWQTSCAVFRVDSAPRYQRKPCQCTCRYLEGNSVTFTGRERDFYFMLFLRWWSLNASGS